MFGNVNTYLNAIQRTWSSQDGILVAQFLSLRDKHANNTNLQIEYPDNIVDRICDSPIDELVSSHLKVLYYLARERMLYTHLFIYLSHPQLFVNALFYQCLARNYLEAYKQQTTCAQSVIKMLQLLKEENWCLPIMYTVCLDLRLLAQKCEEAGGNNLNKPGEILEKAAECLLGCFRVCAADNRLVEYLILPLLK